MDNSYYVYAYLCSKKIPFYIGKGCGKRWRLSNHLDRKHNYAFLKNKIRKIGIENVQVVFLRQNLAEADAHFWEKYWIGYLGRRCDGSGQLVNLTMGGEGMSGHKMSELTKKKRSAKMLGHPFWGGMTGKKHGESTRQKISERLMGIKRSPLSHAHRAKISAALLGKNKPPRSPEYRLNVSIAKTGKRHSSETKLKMSLVHRKRWAQWHSIQ